VLGFNKRKKENHRSLPLDSAHPSHPLPDVEHPARSPSPEAHRSDERNKTTPSTNHGKRPEAAEGAVTVTALAKQVVSYLVPLIDQRDRVVADQIAERFLEGRTAISEHIDTFGVKFAESLVQQLDQQGRDLCESLESQVQPLGDRIVAAATQAAEEHGAALRKALQEACSTTTQRAAQRPVVDGLIALLDRIRDEREFLTTWYRKDTQLALQLGCRQLHERYDDAVGSFAAEIHMILRSLGVEQIAGCSGPFNPQHQRVVALEMAANPDLDGHVAKIVRAGFTWNGTILRPEHVVVFKLERKSDEKEKRR